MPAAKPRKQPKRGYAAAPRNVSGVQLEALEVYLGHGRRSIAHTATILGKNPSVVSRLLRAPAAQAHLRKANEEAIMRDDSIAKIDEIQRVWSEVLRDTEEKTNERLKAGELLAKCRGEFAPEKVAADVSFHVFTPEQDEALEEWMLVREDPRVKMLMADIRREREGG